MIKYTEKLAQAFWRPTDVYIINDLETDYTFKCNWLEIQIQMVDLFENWDESFRIIRVWWQLVEWYIDKSIKDVRTYILNTCLLLALRDNKTDLVKTISKELSKA